MSDVPGDGWEVILLGDVLLVEIIDPLPASNTVVVVSSHTDNPTLAIHRNVQSHGIVRAISDKCGDRWKDVFKVGDRVAVTGAGNLITVNFQDYALLPMTSVGCILRRVENAQPGVSR